MLRPSGELWVLEFEDVKIGKIALEASSIQLSIIVLRCCIPYCTSLKRAAIFPWNLKSSFPLSMFLLFAFCSPYIAYFLVDSSHQHLHFHLCSYHFPKQDAFFDQQLEMTVTAITCHYRHDEPAIVPKKKKRKGSNKDMRSKRNPSTYVKVEYQERNH
jgi:hypothetical protein